MTDPAANPLRIVLPGPPASGKGARGWQLAASPGLGGPSTGALLHEQVETGPPSGKPAEPIPAQGEYLPDDVMCRILSDWSDRKSGGWVFGVETKI